MRKTVSVDLRHLPIDLPIFEGSAGDSVSVMVEATIYFHVVDLAQTFRSAERFVARDDAFARTTLRSFIDTCEPAPAPAGRAELGGNLCDIVGSHVASWGIDVLAVDVRHEQLTDRMVGAVAALARLTRTRRRPKWSEAIGPASATMRVRYVQHLVEYESDAGIAVLLPMPMAIVMPVLEVLRASSIGTDAEAEQTAMLARSHAMSD